MTSTTTDLVAAALDAHGGLARWQQFRRVQATIVSGGLLFELKGQPQDPTPRQMTVSLHDEWGSVQPFGADDQRTDFTPDRIAVEKVTGEVIAEMPHPEQSFVGDELATPWNPLQRAYFNGYALWTYLNSPFLVTYPGFTAREIAPVNDGGRTLRGIQVTFPPGYVSHSVQQEFYLDDDLLVARHDYRVDVAGSFTASQYISDYIEVDGIMVPTTRRAYRCAEDGSAMLDQLMVSIDLSDVHFE